MSAEIPFNSDHLAALLRLNRDGPDKAVAASKFYAALGHVAFHAVLTDLVHHGLAARRSSGGGRTYCYSITDNGHDLLQRVLQLTQNLLAA